GGILPAAKVTHEISVTRGVPMGEDCLSPARHRAFSSPIEMMNFITQLRALSGGKPVGFKLCIGLPWEFMAIVKAIQETGVVPDFIVVDGAEGGTGASPLEFMNISACRFARAFCSSTTRSSEPASAIAFGSVPPGRS